MPNRLFPRSADNEYRGHKLAPWILALVAVLKALVSLNSIVRGRVMAGAGDGIPLEALPPAGVQAVVSLYAAWGLAILMLSLLCLLVLVRYRTLVPLMFALLLLEHLGRSLLLHIMPISTTAGGGDSVGISPVPYGFLVLIIIGLVLSLLSGDNAVKPRRPAEAPP